MTLSVQEMQQRIRDSVGGTFQVTGDEVGAGDLFSRHLSGGSLSIRPSSTDVDTLRVEGAGPITQNTSFHVVASFRAAGGSVTGFTVTFTLDSWQVTTASGSHDFGYLKGLGFTQPCFVLRDDVGAVVTGVLGGVTYRTPVDGSGPVVSESGTPLSLPTVTAAVGFGLPSDLDIYVTDVQLWFNAVDKSWVVFGTVKLTGQDPRYKVSWALVSRTLRGGDGTRQWAGIVRADVALTLSAVPILAGLVPTSDDLVVDHAALLFTKDPLDQADVDEINRILTKLDHWLPNLPAGGLEAGVTATLSYTLGTTAGSGTRELVKIRLGGVSQSWSPQSGQGASATSEKPVAPKSSGPVRLDSILLGYAAGAIRVLIDVTVSMGPVSLQALGLGIDLDLGAGEVRAPVLIKGLGVGIKADPLVAAGVLRSRPDQDYPVRYEGLGLVSLPVLSLAIVGAYAQKTDGQPSMFLFGSLGTGTGDQQGFGPPPFRVKAIYLGGGYNSAVRPAKVNEIASFPLTAGLDNPDILGDPPNPLTVLDVLTKGKVGPPANQPAWVSEQPGEYWAAAGLHFTTFEFADCRAMLLVQFGDDLVVELLALGRFTFPKVLPSGVAPTALVEIAAQGQYRHSEGLLSLTAQLTKNSYLYSKECKPTGGLALCSWVHGEHRGDFVVCVGGYHPAFTVPKHYPAVPRVGVDWAISGKTSLHAQAYVAVVPHGVMFGGALAVVYQSGAVKAWFTAHLDALIQWAPFHYDLAIGVSIGVQARVKVWFVHVTVSVEVGLDVQLWGPPFGGNATVHLWFVSLTIGFGAAPAGTAPVSWTQFQAQLPPKLQKLQVEPVTGLSYQPATDDNDAAMWAARADDSAVWNVTTHGLTFTTTSCVPATELVFGPTSVATAPGTLSIRPMGKSGLDATHKVTITHHDSDDEINYTGWTAEAVTDTVPESLWGSGVPSLDGSGLVTDTYVGLRVTAPAPAYAGQLQVAAGLLDLDHLPSGAMPLEPGSQPQGPVPTASAQTSHLIATEIDQSAVGPRTDLFDTLTALGYAPATNDRLSGYAAQAEHDLITSPLLVPTN